MKLLLREIPFIRFLIALISGIFLAYNAEKDSITIFAFTAIFLFVAIILLILLPTFYKNRKIRWLSGICLFCFLFSTGWILTKKSFPSKLNAEYEVIAAGKIDRIDNRKSDWIRIVFEPEKINNDTIPFKKGDKWLLVLRNDFENIFIDAGSQITIKGIVSGHSKPANPDAFDYGAYLFREGISGQMFIENDNLIVLDKISRMELTDYAEKIRTFCSNIFTVSGVKGAGLGIINALILGDRSGIDQELNDSFIRSGAIHMLAVSGLHVGIIYIVINFVLNIFFKSTSKIRMAIAIVLMFGYAFITGFSPSVSRAVVMFSIMQIGRSMSKEVNTYNTLCASAFFLLLYNPLYLFNTGFWLSHLAVAGIVAFTVPIENLVKSTFAPVKKVWTMISVSISAQLGVLPIMLYLFGAFPVYFLIANILVLPIITPVIIMGIALLTISWIPILSDILVWILNILLRIIEFLITNVDALPYSYLEGIWVSIPMIMTLYFLIIAIYNLFEYISGKKVIVGAIALILTLLVFNVQYFLKTDSKMVVFNAGNQVFIELIDNGKSTTFATSGLTKRNQNFTASAFDRKNVIQTNDFIVFEDIENSKFPLAYKSTVNNKDILILSGGNKDVTINEFDSPSDILVIFGKMNMDIKTTVEKVKCKTVVFASNCPPWIVKKWIKELNDIEIDIKIHNVKENGAYIANL